MIAVVTIALIATVIALFGWLGKAGQAHGVSRVVALAFPLIVVSAAATITDGLTLWPALCAALSVAVGVVIASMLPSKGFPLGSHPGSSAIAAMMSTLVVLGLAVAMIGWSSFVLTAMTGANRYLTITALVIAATAFAAGGVGRTGVARVAMIAAIVAAVLVLIVGIVVGTPGRLSDPVIAVEGPSAFKVIGYGLVIVILGAAHPGLRGMAVTNRKPVLVGGIVSGLIAAAILVGLLSLLGGSMQFPSWPLSIFDSYFPASVTVVVAGFITALCVSTVGENIDSSLLPWVNMRDSLAGAFRPFESHGVVMALVGAWVLVFSFLLIAVGPWITALGVATLIALLIAALAGRTQNSDSPSTVEAEALKQNT